jgi:hypothetical protein
MKSSSQSRLHVLDLRKPCPEMPRGAWESVHGGSRKWFPEQRPRSRQSTDLDPDGRPGLGARARDKFGVPVIGVAQLAFRTGTHAIPALRGASTRPLHVTAAGMPAPTPPTSSGTGRPAPVARRPTSNR